VLTRYTSIIGAIAMLASAAGGVGVAQAATTHRSQHHARRHASASTSASTSTSTGASSTASPETELTGDTAAKAREAALAAVPGGTVERASVEDPADSSGAAYEVHVRKSDGSEVEVLLDSSFKVLAVRASTGCSGGPRAGSGSSSAAS
jgi:uncharacterized membrane protein YkoI